MHFDPSNCGSERVRFTPEFHALSVTVQIAVHGMSEKFSPLLWPEFPKPGGEMNVVFTPKLTNNVLQQRLWEEIVSLEQGSFFLEQISCLGAVGGESGK